MSKGSAMKTRSTNRDPFSRIPIPKSHYHPSQKKKLTKTERRISLSPRVGRPVSPEDESFLRGNKFISSHTPPTREKCDERFDESWPSSERPSYSSLSGCNNESSTSAFDTVYETKDRETLNREKPSTSYKPTSYQDKTTGPVLHRYIDRFRNSQPTSREERQQTAAVNQKDFWWLSSNQMAPSDSSTPKSQRQQSKLFTEKTSEKLYHDKSRSSRGGFESEVDIDLETKKLQDKADRILAESESTVCSIETYDGEPAISTDGLASTLSHTSTSSTNDQPPPSRPHLLGLHPSSQNPTRSQPPGYIERDQYRSTTIPTALPSTTRPEDDILYQWRLQRKMEVARMGAAEMMAKNNSDVSTKLKDIQNRLLNRDLSTAGTSQSNYYFTPHPASTSSDHHSQPSRSQPDQPTPAFTRPNQPGGYRPAIASPSLPTDPSDPVNPHLHLMCDVLPCPHSQQHQKQFQNLYNPSEGQGAAFKQFLEAEKPITDGGTPNSGNAVEKGSRNEATEQDTRFSKYGDDRHVRWAEQDENGRDLNHDNNFDWSEAETHSGMCHSRDIDRLREHENGGQSQTRVERFNDRSESVIENRDDDQTFKKKGDRSRRKADVDSKSDFKRTFNSNGDRNDASIERDGESARQITSEKYIEESGTTRDRYMQQEKENSEHERLQPEISRKSEKQYSNKQNSDTNRYRDTYDSSVRSSSENYQSEDDDQQALPRGQTGSRQLRSKVNQSTLREQNHKESSRSSKHLQPKFASSPAKPKTPVKSAIGQAVKDFLFTTSSGSVMSSVESMSSLMSAVPERSPEEEREATLDEEVEKNEDEYVSDGEFPDDQLLQLLRQQRDDIERRLGEIDRIL